MSAIRVLMVDDHPVDWEGLHAALDQANDVVVVGEARSGESAVEAASKLTPDIVFMDARLPGMSWLDVTKAIREASHTTEVITFGVDELRHRSPRRPRPASPGYLSNVPSVDELVITAGFILQHMQAVSSTQPDPPPDQPPDPPPLPPAASAALAVPMQQPEDVPTHVGKPLRRKTGSRYQPV